MSDPESTSLQRWLRQGEELYETATSELQAIESHLAELEAMITSKRTEVNQIAQILSRPQVGINGLSAAPPAPAAPPPAEKPVEERDRVAASAIARAVAGKFGR